MSVNCAQTSGLFCALGRVSNDQATSKMIYINTRSYVYISLPIVALRFEIHEVKHAVIFCFSVYKSDCFEKDICF